VRILLNAHQAHAPGGIGVVAQSLAQHLPEVLSDSDQLTVVGLDDVPAGQTRDGHRRLGTRSAMARLLYEQTTVAKAAAAADLVHLCDARPLLLSPRPFVTTVHDVTFFDHPEWMPRRVARYKQAMLRAAMLRRPRTVICDSSHTRDRLLARVPSARQLNVAVVHLGVEQVAAEKQWDPAQSNPYFLTLSTIEPRKNHLTLLKAYRELRSAGYGLRWKVAGAPGHLSAPVLAALRAQDGVDVLGFVDAEERERLLRRACFFILPSLEEGFGLPVLDAFARGIPVACSRGSALDEVAGDDAVRVSATDVDGWSNALRTLADDDSLRKDLSQKGTHRSRRFSWTSSAQHVAELYDELRVTSGLAH
jgi:glycosyltransferase involved in cell wall biosynthesis